MGVYTRQQRANNAVDGERGAVNDKSRRPLHAVPRSLDTPGPEGSPSDRRPAGPEQLQLSLPFSQLIDIPTLAAPLGTSERHIRRQIAERKIPYVKVGHLVRFDVVQIAEWLKVNYRRPQAPTPLASGQ